MKHSYSLDQLSLAAQQIINDAYVYKREHNPAGAVVVGLQGELGAGKTTLVQEIARLFGVTEDVTSPTFVVAKHYDITDVGNRFTGLVHMDAYRIEDTAELGPVGFSEFCNRPDTLVIVEWPEKIQHTMKERRALIFSITYDGFERQIEGPTFYE